MNNSILRSNPTSKNSINSDPTDPLIEQNSQLDLPPNTGVLERFSLNCAKSLSHPLTKTIAGAVAIAGATSCYFDDTLCTSKTDYGTLMVCAGPVAWTLSTLLSTSMVCYRHPGKVAAHIAESIGYAVAGVILLPLNICLKQNIVSNDLRDADHFQSDLRSEHLERGRHSGRISDILEGQEGLTNDWQTEPNAELFRSSYRGVSETSES